MLLSSCTAAAPVSRLVCIVHSGCKVETSRRNESCVFAELSSCFPGVSCSANSGVDGHTRSCRPLPPPPVSLEATTASTQPCLHLATVEGRGRRSLDSDAALIRRSWASSTSLRLMLCTRAPDPDAASRTGATSSTASLSFCLRSECHVCGGAVHSGWRACNHVVGTFARVLTCGV